MSALRMSNYQPSDFHLLIVDDDPEVRALTRVFLKRRFNFQMSDASSAAEAIQKLKEREFNFILCDLFMDHDSGLDVFSHLRSHPTINARFVMFTSAVDTLTETQRQEIITIEKPDFTGLIDAIEFLASIDGWML
jgi:CheY-like chemotaxis protein